MSNPVHDMSDSLKHLFDAFSIGWLVAVILTNLPAVAARAKTSSTSTCTVAIPAGWYYAVRQTSGTVSIVSAYDQTAG